MLVNAIEFNIVVGSYRGAGPRFAFEFLIVRLSLFHYSKCDHFDKVLIYSHRDL